MLRMSIIVVNSSSAMLDVLFRWTYSIGSDRSRHTRLLVVEINSYWRDAFKFNACLLLHLIRGSVAQMTSNVKINVEANIDVD